MNNNTPAKIYGLLARFDNPGALLAAAEKFRDAGYTKFDCHSPFPIHGMDDAMGLKRSPVGWIAGLCALIGGSGGFALQWWAHAVAYPLNISGKPYFSFQAYVPVTFALAVLGGAFGSLFGMLILNRLPRPHHALFNSDAFTRFSDDAFLISIDGTDKQFHPDKSRRLLEETGALAIETVQE
jgi:hypothetical protein